MAYTTFNFKSKAALKAAVKAGESKLVPLSCFNPGLGGPIVDGIVYLEGPHYPKPHTWYAQVEVKNGKIVKVIK